MNINIPIKFYPNFTDGTDYYYSLSDSKAKRNLKNVLLAASNNCCMYTYDPIVVGTGEFNGDIEHSIEKSKFIIPGINPFNCKYNLSVSSKLANQKYKKGMVPLGVIPSFKCQRNYNCNKPCKEIIELHVDAIKANKYILMPNMFSSYLNMKECDLQYSLFNLTFNSSEKGTDFSNILDNHIDVFKLNENLFIEQEIISICERVIIHGSFYEQCATVNSNHTIVLFVNKMRKLSDIKCVILATTILDNAKINIPNCNRNKSISIDLPIKVKFVSDDCTYLTPESYGVAKRRFNDDEIIKKYYGVIYPFTKR